MNDAHIPLNSQIVAKAAPNLSHLVLDGADLYWLQSQPQNKGRIALMRYADDRIEEVLDAAFNVRSRVHEYGGGAYTVRNRILVFCNESDQVLYLKTPEQAPIPITAPDTGCRYADLHITPDGKRLICVRESQVNGSDAVAELISIDLHTPFHVRVLQQGQDFYASPRVSADGKKLCWLSWNHPHMPWDQSCLSVADITADGGLQHRVDLAYPNAAILQPTWGPLRQNQPLYFISDHQGWWNIYRLQDGAVTPVTQTPFDHARPPWIFGLSNYAALDNGHLVCSYTEQGAWVLCLIDPDSLQTKIITRQFAEISYIQAAGDTACFIASTPTSAQSIQCFEHTSGELAQLYQAHNPASGCIKHYALAAPFSFNNPAGETVYALYYAPHTTQAKPALLVMAHGGPTSQFETALDLKIQYWTAHGFAVCAVNYAGSSGYGRAYRNRLQHQWGIADVQDCIAAAEHLVAQGTVDAHKIAIKGSSAGGYTVLRALADTDFFDAGASYYGISDLILLCEQTHKFESRYNDWLIGPYATHADILRERSPIQQTGQWKTPVLFLQGGKDKIVPPNQATQLYATLKQKNVDTELVMFADEGHGFRQEQNIATALERERAFYRRVL